MWQSRVEIEHYSVTIEIELMVPVEGCNHPGYCVQVWAISVACSRSYAPLNPRRSTNYACDASMRIVITATWKQERVFISRAGSVKTSRWNRCAMLDGGREQQESSPYNVVSELCPLWHVWKCVRWWVDISVWDLTTWLVLCHLAGYVIASSVKEDN